MKLSDRHELAISMEHAFAKFGSHVHSNINWVGMADHVLRDVGELEAREQADMADAIQSLDDSKRMAKIRDEFKRKIGDAEYQRIIGPLLEKWRARAEETKETHSQIAYSLLSLFLEMKIPALAAAPILCALADVRGDQAT